MNWILTICTIVMMDSAQNAGKCAHTYEFTYRNKKDCYEALDKTTRRKNYYFTV